MEPFLLSVFRVTYWDIVVCVVFLSFVIFPYGVLGQVWYLIVPIPDRCPFPYFHNC